MSRPRFQEFSVIVEYNQEGEATGVKYFDQEGCGHESGVFDPDNQVMRSLVVYHLNHLQISHEMVPPKRCGEIHYMPKDVGLQHVELRCAEEEGHEGKHAFTW